MVKTMAIVRKSSSEKLFNQLKTGDVGNSLNDVIRHVAQLGLYYLPIPVENIIKCYGLQVVYDSDMEDDLSGYIEVSGNTWCIGINQYHSARRQRFTLAHELAHYILHRDQIQREGRHTDKILLRDGENGDIEAEANHFAGHLLVPKQSLLELVANPNKRNISTLADAFDVSIAAIRYRAHQEGLLRRV